MKLTIEQALKQGVAAHKKGKLQDAERLYRAILQSQPAHPDANHNLGVIAVSVNNYNAALPLFKTALDANPKAEQFWLSYIDALIKDQQFRNAQQALEQAKTQCITKQKLHALDGRLAQVMQAQKSASTVQERLTFSERRQKLAKQKARAKTRKSKLKANHPPPKILNNLLRHYQNGQLNEAEKLAVEITRQFPKHQFAWKVLGAVLGAAGRKSEAAAANQKAVLLDPRDAEAHSNLGVTLQEIGKLGEAETSYIQAITLKPDHVQAHFNLGITLQNLGRLDEAKASYTKAVAIRPDYAEAHNNLGIVLKELGRIHEASASCAQAIALKPDYAEAHNNFGIILRELGELDAAESSLNQAIALKSDYAEAYSNLGMTLKEQGRLEDAEASYTEAIALKSDYVEAHYNFGLTLTELGKFSEAEASYGRAITLKFDFAEAHCNLGNTLKELGRLDEAAASYKKAIALEPDFARAHCNFGVSLKELGRLDEAEASYIKAIALKPDLAEAHYNLGIVSYIRGDIDSALVSFRKAQSIDSKFDTYELIDSIIQARNSRKETRIDESEINAPGYASRLSTDPLILNRKVESELISVLLQMNSRTLDRTSDARFGNGRCSPDFNLFQEDNSAIKTVADDLTTIMKISIKSDIYIVSSFFNILSAGGGSSPHNHLKEIDGEYGLFLGRRKFSLVYYLSVGDQNCSEPGILQLFNPAEEILPSEGMIVVIPADRNHCAVYGGDKDRIMIGVNFYSV